MNSKRNLVLFFMIILPVFIIGIYSYVNIRNANTEKLYQQHKSTASLSAKILKEKFDRLRDLGVSLSRRILLIKFIEEGKWFDAMEYIEYVPSEFGFIERMGINDTLGNTMASFPSNPQSIGINFAYRDWFKGVSKVDEPYLSEVYKRSYSPYEVVTSLASPIKNGSGKTIAYLVLQANISKLLEWRKSVNFGDNGNVFVVDQSGRIGANIKASFLDTIIDYSAVTAVQKALKGENKVEVLYNIIDKKNYLTAYEQIPGYGWAVIVQQDEKTLMGVGTSLLYFLAAIFILVILLAFYIIKQITKREKAEKNLELINKDLNESILLLKESEEKFAKIFENSPVGISIGLLPEGTLVDINTGFLDMFGYSREEVLGKTSIDLNLIDAIEREAIKNELMLRGKVNEREITVTKKSGEKFSALISLDHFTFKGQQYGITISYNISERKKAENEIKEAYQFVDAIVENIPTMLFVKDADNLRFVRFNKAGEALLGYDRNDLIGKNDFDFFPEQQAAFFTEKDKQVLIDGGVTDILEEPIQTKSGLKWLHTRKIPLKDNSGKVKFLIGISEDITEQKIQEDKIKQLNKELEKNIDQLEIVNKELEAFTYSVSHDLRAPLRAVDGYAKIIEEDYQASLNEEGKRLLAIIQFNAKKMGTLIDDLLAFSRLGKKELKKVNIDMQEMVNAALYDIEKVEKYNAEIEIGILHPIKADYALLTQVCINLISNAIKYSSKKEKPKVKISSELNNGDVIYCIEDNGVGFNMQYVHKLFGVFQRLHSMEEFQGTGVGLAIVQRIIAKHGGKIWAEAEIDVGAKFYFSLPLN
jgi:PAS domain S-box-containing protein